MPEEERTTCPTCRGEEGWWEHGNGQPGKAKPARWIKCMTCNGKGTVPA